MIARNPRVLLLANGAELRTSLQASFTAAGTSGILCDSDVEAFAHIESARPKIFCSQFDARNPADVHRIELVMNLYPRLAIVLIGSSDEALPPDAKWLDRIAGYVSPPWNFADVISCLSSALCPEETDPIHASKSDPFLIGRSQAMQQVADAIVRLVDCPQPILIQGEHGTGKKLTALALHCQSANRLLSFHSLDCAELDSEHLAGLLFGPSRSPSLPPMLQDARVGTIVLGELAAISPAVQSKLIDWIRGRDLQAACPRVVFTTSRDLGRLVANRKVRADLFLELSNQVIGLPPLRHRRGDIRLLVEYFAMHLDRYLEGIGKPLLQIDEPLLQLLESHEWPFNVRELRAILVSAALQEDNQESTASTHLAKTLAASAPTTSNPVASDVEEQGIAKHENVEPVSSAESDIAIARTANAADLEPVLPTAASVVAAEDPRPHWALMVDRLANDSSPNIYARALEMFERELFTRVLDKTGGNIEDSARLLGMTNLSLKKKIQHLEIKVPEINA